MPKRRWDRKRRRLCKVKPRRAEARGDTVDIYYDPETRMMLKAGPDHGTEERRTKDGGIIVGQKAIGLSQSAWVAAPGALELLRLEGGLEVGLQAEPLRGEMQRRWLEGAETLRGLAIRAGVQKRTTGRYDFGALGRGEMSEKAVAAFDRLTTLSERITWSKLGPLMDLCLFETLPPGLRRPVLPKLPLEGEPEFPAYLSAARRNPAVVLAMQRAVDEGVRQHPGRMQVWEQACREVQQLLDALADAFGLRLPRETH